MATRGMAKAFQAGEAVRKPRESSESNLMLLPGAKTLSLANADEPAIGANNVTCHANGPLPRASTVMVLKTGRQ
jgi:hypothetical protein